jgi:hypothetical protein
MCLCPHATILGCDTSCAIIISEDEESSLLYLSKQ